MSSATPPTPPDRNLIMPPEWDRHAATWTSWPFDDELWVGHLEGVRTEFARLVATIARFEPVIVNVRDDEVERDARERITVAAGGLSNVDFNRVALNDVWFRDNGPLFVRRGGDGPVSLTDWRFNAWGGKYAPWDDDDRAPIQVAERLGMLRHPIDLVMEGGSLEINGQGVCLTTRSCLLSPERNPGVGMAQLEAALARWLGVTEVVWLGAGLEGDHTDGHIDTIVRFTDDHTIVCSVEDDVSDPNHATMKANLEQLREWSLSRGGAYRIVPLPLPRRRMELEGVRLPLTYANFYVGNGFVVLPQYDDENDAAAIEVLKPLFPGREVIGLPTASLITGGGAFHCVTQQQPEGEVERG